MMLEGATALIDYMKAFEKNIQHKIERFDTNIDWQGKSNDVK